MISDEVRIPLIAAAATAAGDSSSPDWSAKVAAAATDLFVMADPSSSISRRLERVAESKKFAATIASVQLEESSTRVSVGLKSKPSEFHPDGIEYARTERTDNPEGAAFAAKLNGLVGHRVLAFIALDEIGKGATARKMRVLVHVEDLGVDRFGDNAPQAAPVQAVVTQPEPATAGPWGQGGYADDTPPF